MHPTVCLSSFKNTFSIAVAASVLLVPIVEDIMSKTLWILRMTSPKQCENGMKAQDCSGLHVENGGRERRGIHISDHGQQKSWSTTGSHE